MREQPGLRVPARGRKWRQGTDEEPAAPWHGRQEILWLLKYVMQSVVWLLSFGFCTPGIRHWGVLAEFLPPLPSPWVSSGLSSCGRIPISSNHPGAENGN